MVSAVSAETAQGRVITSRFCNCTLLVCMIYAKVRERRRLVEKMETFPVEVDGDGG